MSYFKWLIFNCTSKEENNYMSIQRARTCNQGRRVGVVNCPGHALQAFCNLLKGSSAGLQECISPATRPLSNSWSALGTRT